MRRPAERAIFAELRLIAVATQVLTRLPVPSFDTFEPSWLDRSTRYFPLVGLAVGLIAGGVLLGAAELWPQPIPALLAVAAGLVVTGALHEDGLADTADGLGGGATPARRLEIMKDSRIGTYGVAALVLALALKVASLAVLAPAEAAAALVAAHAGARLAPVVMIRAARYAGDPSIARLGPFQTRPSVAEIAVASVVAGLAVAGGLGAAVAVIAAFAAVLAAGGVALLANRLIGGYTGDVLGAMEQAAEVAVLLAASASLGVLLPITVAGG